MSSTNMKNNVKEFYVVINDQNEYFSYPDIRGNPVWTKRFEDAWKYESVNDFTVERNYFKRFNDSFKRAKVYKVKVETSFAILNDIYLTE